ncbi:MAG TPA: UbiD family decarboxylase [Pseudolabrys sp.]|uniref:UbiD family decarboxylase n=1 Tax=Pseudolabrys sp. TaxID=1960880 RepID=UPI002DDCA625|nr:UbiD family decarboxylase [Pseudolabrys sp.]HEV2630343.1 UbiD family decarboxylase [Pseudolabrys sp.]
MLNPVSKPDTASGDQTMPRLDLQQHLQDLDRAGLLVRIDRPINKDTQLHPLVRWQFLGGIPADDRRAFLFTNVIDAKGRKYDMPVVVGAFSASARIYALGMGQKVEDIGNAWLKAIQNPIPPVRVEHAACQEVVVTGAALREKGGGVAALPVPISTPGFDAAPYLTATLCVTRDPETGVQNMGTYRAGLKATDRMAVRMVARPGGAGGYIHWLKYRERKEPMEIAIVIGAAPIVEFTGPQKLAIDVDEMAVAGGLAGRPIPMARCVSVDLDVPADSEIVIEGVIDTSILEPEAPFGESNGYVALEAFNMPMRVTAITRRKNAVFASIISQVTPSESSTIKIVAYEPVYLAHLRDQLGIRGVKRVVMHEPLTNLRPVVFLQMARETPRTEVWRALQGTANFTAGVGKICIAVSEDIDPTNTDAVLWSMAYRSNPIEDVHITPWRGGVQGANYSGREADSTMLIDATLKHNMPPLALPRKEFMDEARGIWEELGLPNLTVREPWHGYTLGDWTETWEKFARRAVAGDWEINGLETAQRVREGVEPETPVWHVEKDAK